ncbi:MAG: (d)CMP kinase [Verrucomicrobia bacterium]|nr:(d)CMP kinase [Verrucomicrobiota bacterium]MBU1735365.1 (d)CMP kinase [Verrucomicrobiota bacterium]MBU1857480.1 (d)CMP kinase [Verrucomicrobiota bacterium]
MHFIIAIDGPSASGKSTVSRKVAESLGYVHVDSGAIYRALTWQIIRDSLAGALPEAIVRHLPSVVMRFFVEEGAIRFAINDVDPGTAIRSLAVQEQVSAVAAIPEVRAWVGERLRSLTTFGDLVVEGRDIGTVVFPEAAFKFYLDADPEERARRRYREQQDLAGDEMNPDEVKRALLRRDACDLARSTAPLAMAPGACRIETTHLAIEDVVAQIVSIVRSSPQHRITKAIERDGFNPFAYHFSRVFFLCYLWVFHRYATHGLEHVPREGGCILVSNHASFLDPIAVCCDIWNRHVYFLARDTLFKQSRFMKWWAIAVGTLPIDRTKGDIRALKGTINLVRQGNMLCLFPEGTRTRNGRLQPVKAGIGFLIEKAGVPVIPAYVSGTFEAFPRDARWIKPRKITTYFGKPVTPADCAVFKGDPERHQKIADLVMARIAALDPAGISI